MRDDVAWAEDEEGGRTTLVVTPSGLRAIGVAPEDGAEAATTELTSASMKSKVARRSLTNKAGAAKKVATRAHKRPTSAKSGRGRVKTNTAGKAAPPRTAAKGLTKQKIVVGMLRWANGASIAELAAATDWQPHSVRGVLTATVKGRLSLPLISEKGADGVQRYHVAALRTSKGRE